MQDIASPGIFGDAQHLQGVLLKHSIVKDSSSADMDIIAMQHHIALKNPVQLMIAVRKLPSDVLPESREAASARNISALKTRRAAVVRAHHTACICNRCSTFTAHRVVMQQAWAPAVYVQYVAYMYRPSNLHMSITYFLGGPMVHLAESYCGSCFDFMLAKGNQRQGEDILTCLTSHNTAHLHSSPEGLACWDSMRFKCVGQSSAEVLEVDKCMGIIP